jgi:uncharacterized membrane protein (GlpM family)
MHFSLKLLISNLIILLCVWLGRRFPSLAGLIATMPLTTLIVLLWLYSDKPGDRGTLTTYVGGVFFGVLPTLCFFGVVWLCLRRGGELPVSLLAGFLVWAVAASLHQLLLR